MKKIRLISGLFLIIFSLFVFQNCSSSSDGDPLDPGGNNPIAQNYGIALGKVLTTFGSAIDGVNVNIGSKTGQTNAQGWFTIADVPAGDRQQIVFEKDGYISNAKIIDIQVGQTSYIETVLGTRASSYPITVSTGGTANSNGGSSVVFPADAFVDEGTGAAYTGTATVAADYFDPTSDYYEEVFPGDFTGIPASGGSAQPIESFGFMDVELEGSSGQALQLANGKQATLTIPIPNSIAATAPATIPLWYYDTSDGNWKEEGSAVKAGNTYVGTVTHFTSWNWDRLYDVAYLTGRVIDGDGNPIAGARVEANGNDYSGKSYRTTGSDGTFNIGVRNNSSVTVTAAKGGVTSSPLVVNPTPATGQTQAIGDIVLAAPIATITLTWGQSPSDLDSHLSIPASTTGGSNGHVYYGSKGSMSSYPYANLDTDDVSSYGPEVVTIFRKYTGTYKYWIHDYTNRYSETGFAANSGAKISLVIGGSLYTFNVPSGNASAADSWYVFDLVATDGGITVQTQNTFMDQADIPGTTQLGKMSPK